jgi:uncharacterized membrane protein
MSAFARTLLFAIVVLLFFTTPATAALSLCNRTSYILYVATATETSSEVASHGWTRVVPGACQTVLASELSGVALDVYARTSQAHSGPARAWGGERQICVQDTDFNIRTPSAVHDCPSDNFYVLPFARIDTRRMASWTSTLSESPSLASLTDARTAGLKRLLHDIGYPIATIDGHPDKEAERALADFRKRLHVKPEATAAELFDALETTAFKIATPAGYSICNDTAKPIAAALGEESAGNWISHGWWKVAPGSCARAITAPLAVTTLYLYAQTVGGPVLVGGKDKFCVADIEFDIQGRTRCKDRGLGELGFAATPVKGLSGFAAHVGETGLLRDASARLPRRR